MTGLFKFKYKTLLFLAVTALVFLSHSASAATVYVTTNATSVNVGDTIIAKVMFNPAGQYPNTVEGNIAIATGTGNILLSQFDLAGSALTEWPDTPSLDTSSSISFTGGVPGGFATSSVLFEIIFVAQKEGQITFSPANVVAYNNDGNATPITISENPLTIAIGPRGSHTVDEWDAVLSSDTQPPQNLAAVIGQDSSVFDGEKFLTISATDDQSGISYYAVQEGSGPIVRTGSVYLLQDQSGKTPITVFAYDRAGNVSKIVLGTNRNSASPWNYSVIIMVVLLLLGILYLIFLRA